MFQKIDDIGSFCNQNNVKWKKCIKTVPIKIVRKAKAGEDVETIASNGTKETKHKITDTENGWIVCNATNADNQWVIQDDVIKRDYTNMDGSSINAVKPG